MTDKHGVEVKIGDKVIGIDMKFNPPLRIGKITDIVKIGMPNGEVVKLGDEKGQPRFYSREVELWTSDRELIAKLEILTNQFIFGIL
jgi:hypothetical protein